MPNKISTGDIQSDLETLKESAPPWNMDVTRSSLDKHRKEGPSMSFIAGNVTEIASFVCRRVTIKSSRHFEGESREVPKRIRIFLVTNDTRIHRFDHETKQQSMTWKVALSLTPKKFKTS